MPVISVDYMHMHTKLGAKAAGEEEGEPEDGSIGMPMLVMKDRCTKAKFANVAPAKGRDPYAIKRFAQDIALLWYKKMIIKDDQEPAIVDLRNAV